jgi:putative SOS response-associated peptidase YedK
LTFVVWLDPGMKDVGSAPQLLKPFDAGQMRCFRVSTPVNQVANDNEECSAPVDLTQVQAILAMSW